jgi:integrase
MGPEATEPLKSGVNNRGALTANGIYQMIARLGRQWGVEVYPHSFRHHFSHTWLDRGGAEDLMELNGWTFSQMLRRYGVSVRSARGAPDLRPNHGRHPATGAAIASALSRRLRTIDAGPVPAEIRYSVMLDMEVIVRRWRLGCRTDHAGATGR